MRYGPLDRFQTGVAIPVASLRSERSGGIGEFADLVPFARWAKTCGLDLVQILPVQDTGEDPSPYGAVSAAALHPIYLRLDDIDGFEQLREEIEPPLRSLRDSERIRFAEVLRIKHLALLRLFDRHDPQVLGQELAPWIEQNPWVRSYAVYRMLRDRNLERPWRQWSTFQDPVPADIERFWNTPSASVLFHVWVQRECDRQLAAASRALDEMGVRLKGDLPILLNEDSCDVWLRRELFDLDGRAGAPPDMYSEFGQNWGFPLYRWEAMAEDDYAWWRERLHLASRYYHAVRIDHVLGFFRIWRIPVTSETGMLGRFDPAIAISREELHAHGFDDERIAALMAPEGRAGSVFPTEREYAVIEDEQERVALLRRIWNRVLLAVDAQREEFRPTWTWFDSGVFHSLSEPEREALHRLMSEDGSRQEALWERTGRERLRMVTASTDMLVCAEDLGAVPQCVPGVLRELEILGLRVERWCREWNQPGQPFVPPSSFERGTVCTPGVHDASPLRAWWEENPDDRRSYWQALGHEGDPPEHLEPSVVREILERNLAADSILCVFALQDLLALTEDLRSAEPAHERINVPGTQGKLNWHYRMPGTIEQLTRHSALRDTLQAGTDRRRGRPLG